MAEYIERELAMSHPFANGKYDHEHAPEHFILGHESYKEWLEFLPAADVRENKHGHWIGGELIPNNESGLFYAECSECHKVRVIDNFCPSCGADMMED